MLQGLLDSGSLDDKDAIKVKLDLEDAQSSFDKFKSSIDDSAKGWARSFGAIAGMGSIGGGLPGIMQAITNGPVGNVANLSFPGAVANAAGGMWGSTGSGFVNDVRESYGNMDAYGRASARLGGIAAHFAREGVPIDPKLEREIAPMLLAQEREVGKGERIANDIYGDRASTDLGDVFYDVYAGMRRLMGLDATKQRR